MQSMVPVMTNWKSRDKLALENAANVKVGNSASNWEDNGSPRCKSNCARPVRYAAMFLKIGKRLLTSWASDASAAPTETGEGAYYLDLIAGARWSGRSNGVHLR
jgi:hypothetical protein